MCLYSKKFIIFLLSASSLLVLVMILYNDAVRFDTTEGAYEYPHTGYTGQPFNFDTFQVTPDGLRDTRGIIMEFEINCTSGVITGFFGPIPIPIKELSERAIVIHQPQTACLKNGFVPKWSY